ncbi:MAG: hypothetical protein AB7O31_12345 [Burkholderiales bacterium]
MRLAVALCALLAVLVLPGAQAQELGRLFLTPDERAALDARRAAKLPDKPAAAAVVASPVTRIDGYVQRSGGPSTVWVNGEALTEGAAQSTVRIHPGSAGEASIAFPAEPEPRETRARVGQSVDTLTGEIRDPLGDGEIRVKRPGTRK